MLRLHPCFLLVSPNLAYFPLSLSLLACSPVQLIMNPTFSFRPELFFGHGSTRNPRVALIYPEY